jgi:DNA-binding response OmpR family regulator
VSARRPRLLIVEDEAHLASGLKLNFELEGFDVDLAPTARAVGPFLLRPEPYAAIILDVMLPDGDGFSICRKLRDAGNFTPVIMLTARGKADDRVHGLDAGADDYVAKPFELQELIARVRSLIRRRGWDQHAPEAGEVLEFGRARVDFDTHEVTVGGEPRKLTQLELDLLRFFAQNVRRVVSRDELLEKVWKLANSPNTRSVDNFILRLRKHFEPDPEHPVHFVSHRGTGYKFVPEPDPKK